MKSFIAVGLVAITGLVAATTDVPVKQNPDGTFTCDKPNVNYCAGSSLGTDIIFRCDATGKGQPGRCSDNTAGQPPQGVGSSLCWQSSPSAGDAACEKNCVVYVEKGGKPFTLPGCKPTYTATTSTATSTTTSKPTTTSTPCDTTTTTSTKPTTTSTPCETTTTTKKPTTTSTPCDTTTTTKPTTTSTPCETTSTTKKPTTTSTPCDTTTTSKPTSTPCDTTTTSKPTSTPCDTTTTTKPTTTPCPETTITSSKHHYPNTTITYPPTTLSTLSTTDAPSATTSAPPVVTVNAATQQKSGIALLLVGVAAFLLL